MAMIRKVGLMLSISLLTLAAGCPGKEEPPPAATSEAEGPAATTSPAAPPASTAEVPPATACATSNATGDYREASIRITLNSDGTVNKVEGKNTSGVWESPRKEVTTPPESFGPCIASIEIHALNESTADLQNPDGTPAHPDAGVSNPPYNTHCHVWVYQNGVNKLVHC
jgi:hypothetical protein